MSPEIDELQAAARARLSRWDFITTVLLATPAGLMFAATGSGWWLAAALGSSWAWVGLITFLDAED
jgi:hypothetical protein